MNCCWFFPRNPGTHSRHTGFHVFSSSSILSPVCLGSWVTPCSTRSAALHVAVQNLPRRVINPSYPLINEQFSIGNGPSMIYLLKHVELLQGDLCSINTSNNYFMKREGEAWGRVGNPFYRHRSVIGVHPPRRLARIDTHSIPSPLYIIAQSKIRIYSNNAIW